MIEIRCARREALTPEEAAQVGDAVSRGGIILYPTDTLYGLGVDPLSPTGLESLFRLKRRVTDKPVPVLLSHASLVGRYAAAVPAPWRALMSRFWPGPLTLLFPALPGLPAGISSASGKVALRVPGSALCCSILAAAGGSLTGTSANLAGAGATGDPDDALRGVEGGVAVLVNAGTLPPSAASTVLDMDGSDFVTELRSGVVPAQAWRRALEGASGTADVS